MLEMELTGGRRRGGDQRRLMGVVMEDMEMAGLTAEETGDGVRWRQMFCWVTPDGT